MLNVELLFPLLDELIGKRGLPGIVRLQYLLQLFRLLPLKLLEVMLEFLCNSLLIPLIKFLLGHSVSLFLPLF